jgi:acetyl esterase/lipase
MNRGTFIVTAIVGVFISNTALGAGKAPAQPIPDNVRVEHDVPYLPGSRKEKADLYFPAEIPAGKKLPAIVIIHGGGFNDGDKAKYREVNIGTNAAQHGYVGMSINYRLWFKEASKPTWPQSLLDAKTAVRWLRANAERLHLDPENIGAIGCSAGGNLVSMLAVTRPQDGLEPEHYPAFSSAVKCAVDFYGAVDLPHYHDMKMFLKTREEAPELYLKASPITYTHKAAAPLLIVHGTADETVSITQSEAFVAALKKAQAPHEFVMIPDATHTFDLQPPQRDLRPLVFGFLDRHLKPGAKALE